MVKMVKPNEYIILMNMKDMKKSSIFGVVLFWLYTTITLFGQLQTEDVFYAMDSQKYLEYLKVNPSVVLTREGKIDWANTIKNWRDKISKQEHSFSKNGCFGVLFYKGNPILIAELFHLPDNSQKGYFASKQIMYYTTLYSIDSLYCKVQAEIRYGYETPSKEIYFRCEGKYPFVSGIMILPSLNNDICYAIFKDEN